MQNKINNLLKERYYLPTEDTWEQLATRVSAIYPPILEDIKNKAFLPSTPTLMNANTDGQKKGTLSSCFTMGIEDSIEGIFDSLKEGAVVTKSSGGVGYDFSALRSDKEGIKSLYDRPSSGPIPFMLMFNQMLDGIQQGGVRRGAGMGMLRVDHPNILDFIRLKDNKGVCERLNLSVKMTDEFYEKLKNEPNSPHYVKQKNGPDFILEDNGKPVTVKQLWNEIIEYAWKCAEPGIVNEDIAYRQCTVTNLSDKILTNPCSEFVNIPYSSCNLGSINLNKCVINGIFDWTEFERLVRVSTRFLNNVIDKNDFPIEKIRETTLKVRPIGLGAMGYAHMLYRLGIPFNSEEANTLCNDIFYYLTMFSMMESIEIAKETGKSYPAFDLELFSNANERFFTKDSIIYHDIKKYGIANSCFTSIAPNGCRNKKSEIILADGTISSMEYVFKQNNIDLGKIEKREKQNKFNFISAKTDSGENVIEDFYYNYSLVKVDNNTAKWVRNDKIKTGDIILKRK